MSLRIYDRAIDKLIPMLELSEEIDRVPGPERARELADLFSRGLYGTVCDKRPCYRMYLFIEDRAQKRLVGFLPFTEYGSGEVELGYRVFKQYRRKRWASDALRLAIANLRIIDAELKITALSRSENTASREILEKAGFRMNSIESNSICAYSLSFR